jgi:hypothetical protein
VMPWLNASPQPKSQEISKHHGLSSPCLAVSE